MGHDHVYLFDHCLPRVARCYISPMWSTHEDIGSKLGVAQCIYFCIAREVGGKSSFASGCYNACSRAFYKHPEFSACIQFGGVAAFLAASQWDGTFERESRESWNFGWTWLTWTFFAFETWCNQCHFSFDVFQQRRLANGLLLAEQISTTQLWAGSCDIQHLNQCLCEGPPVGKNFANLEWPLEMGGRRTHPEWN